MLEIKFFLLASLSFKYYFSKVLTDGFSLNALNGTMHQLVDKKLDINA
jgi:hypothetical protein